MELRIARGCEPTARTLRELLVAEGVTVDGTGPRVCWGAGTGTDERTLNGRCSAFNKLQQLETLHRAGVAVPMFARRPTPEMFPAFKRNLNHHAGRDIRVCLQPEDANRFQGANYYFTKFLPSNGEFRVWIYRRQHLGTYKKMLRHPEQQRGHGRNHDNGYAFELVPQEQIPRDAVEVAARAVTALQLDFGAVDILHTMDNRYVVLEVNTAPGVEGDGRQCIQALARKIAKWEQLRYPARSTRH